MFCLFVGGIFCICVFRFSHSFCDAALWVTFHLQQHHTDSVCTHGQLQGPLQPASFKRRGSMITISPWQCAVQHRHCPLSKQHFLDEQRQACLLLVSRYFQGDSVS